MNRATRDRFASGTDQKNLTGGNSTWQTPPDIYADLHRTFKFDVDLFAAADTALHRVWLGPGSEWCEDALEEDWSAYGDAGFANPPYGRFIRRVVAKAIEQAKKDFTTVLLIPFRLTVPVRTAIFRTDWVREVWVPDRRITFYENGEPRRDKDGKPMPALFDSLVMVFGRCWTDGPKWKEWKVPKHA